MFARHQIEERHNEVGQYCTDNACNENHNKRLGEEQPYQMHSIRADDFPERDFPQAHGSAGGGDVYVIDKSNDQDQRAYKHQHIYIFSISVFTKFIAQMRMEMDGGERL